MRFVDAFVHILCYIPMSRPLTNRNILSIQKLPATLTIHHKVQVTLT
jgi:hypothetical protein